MLKFFTPVLTPGNQWVDCIKNPHQQKLCNFWIPTTFVSDVFLKNHFPLRYWANYFIPCIKIIYKSLKRLPSTDTIFRVLQTSTARKLTTQDFTSRWLIHYRAPVYVTHNLFPSRKCVLVKLTLLLPILLESGGKDDKSF